MVESVSRIVPVIAPVVYESIKFASATDTAASPVPVSSIVTSTLSAKLETVPAVLAANTDNKSIAEPARLVTLVRLIAEAETPASSAASSRKFFRECISDAEASSVSERITASAPFNPVIVPAAPAANAVFKSATVPVS